MKWENVRFVISSNTGLVFKASKLTKIRKIFAHYPSSKVQVEISTYIQVATYFLTLSPNDAKYPMEFCTVWDTSWMACNRSLIVFFSSLSLSSSSSSSLPISYSCSADWCDDPVIHLNSQFLWINKVIKKSVRHNMDNFHLLEHEQ